ncbi:hypothetical protein FRC06_007302 [Ceratobasidium sp. 370]|nr:hypothetical protein FRC06_007302 [Ceratobasidium sp. 370]
MRRAAHLDDGPAGLECADGGGGTRGGAINGSSSRHGRAHSGTWRWGQNRVRWKIPWERQAVGNELDRARAPREVGADGPPDVVSETLAALRQHTKTARGLSSSQICPMELRLPPIRDLNLSQTAYPPPRDERLAKILAHCQALCAFADHYASVAPNPDQSEVAQMVDRAVEVIAILEDYRRASYPAPAAPAPPPAPVARPPKRPWEDADDEQATRRVAASPPADRSSPGSSSSPAPRVPTAQEVHMHVFDGIPERIAPMDDSAKAVAARDMEDIRARRAAGQAAAQGKVKYKKRSRASPPGHCHSCEILDTPEWRRGPDGQRTLCNACGLHYAKLVRKRDRIISSLPAGGPVPPPIDIAYLRRSARLAAENSALARSAGRRRAAEEAKKVSKHESKRTSNSEGGAGRDAGTGRRGWGRRERQDAEPTLSPIQSSFPRAQATSPYPPPPSVAQMSPNHIHAASPVQPTATSLPPLAPMHNTLPSMRQSYPPLVPSYPSAPHPGPYQGPYAQPPPPYPMQHPAYGPPPHGYPQQPAMPGSMPPPPQPGSWDHYAPSNNGREPRP